MSEELTEMAFFAPAIADTAAAAKPRLWGIVRHTRRTQHGEKHALAHTDSTRLHTTAAAGTARYSSNEHKSSEQRKAALHPAGISAAWLLLLPICAGLWLTRKQWAVLLKLILQNLKSNLL